MSNQISKAILIFLAVLGMIVLFGIVSMMFMHGAMMGGTFNGIASFMMQACNGMMSGMMGAR
jgi:hypothetical protein